MSDDATQWDPFSGTEDADAAALAKPEGVQRITAALDRWRESGGSPASLAANPTLLRYVRAMREHHAGEWEAWRLANADAVGGTVEHACVTVRNALPDCPVPDDVCVPVGYRVDNVGTWKLSTSHERPGDLELAPFPIVVQSRGEDAETGIWSLRLTWRDADQVWRFVDATRDVCVTGRSLNALASVGLPVSSATCGDLAAYIAAADATASYHLPLTRTTRRRRDLPDLAHRRRRWSGRHR
mgnify:CR=1 FL=1